MRLPIGDIQFWIVSAVAFVCLLGLLRAVGVIGPKRRRGRKVKLTVGGKPRK
ncbi:MAG: hypothetical protein DHS20C14_16400 [Phycisphaeraceae bacterium]|nr:MAG: hypothetical protein DHS20C14_16400 [Phycisphaeraceae bacterium]